MIVYFQLFFEFFRTGLFAVGGGLATLPFLYDIADKYTWFDEKMIADMIAVSQSTPGPIGINMATYAGFEAGGIMGSIIATVGLVLPSFVIIIIVANFLKEFRESKTVNGIFLGLRPAVAGLISLAWFDIMKLSVFTFDKYIESKNIVNIFDYRALGVFIVLVFISNKYKKHPAIILGLGAAAGIILGI
ncbi:MAG: chromate transporter [Romboutsia sp.]